MGWRVDRRSRPLSSRRPRLPLTLPAQQTWPDQHRRRGTRTLRPGQQLAHRGYEPETHCPRRFFTRAAWFAATTARHCAISWPGEHHSPADRVIMRCGSITIFWRAARLVVFGLIVLSWIAAHAGGPLNVAGVSWFNSGLAGTPLLWPGGVLNYYTDQGSLSPVLDQSGADSFVADGFSRWTSITTAAVVATRAGQLAENVSGSNVYNEGGQIVMPTDILPTATNKPLAIVYDADGEVTDALLGQGAGGSDMCSTNSVYGGPDNFDPGGTLAHALLVINGNCAQSSDQLPDLKYRLVRQLGRILGLDWSQLNFNVLTGGPPPPTGEDLYGFPVMHGRDIVCVPISSCLPSPDQPKMDDRAALSRLDRKSTRL